MRYGLLLSITVTTSARYVMCSLVREVASIIVDSVPGQGPSGTPERRLKHCKGEVSASDLAT